MRWIIMQQLFDILAHKLTLTNTTPRQLLNKAQKDALLDELIIEKKKESLRILVETRLQQSIDSRRITEHEELNHILQRTYKVMTIQDPELPFPQHENPLSAIVSLYIEFFTRQNCSHRAQEIANIHKKKLCPKGLLPSTLFNWLVEWTRKHFQEFLKTTIHSLYVDSRQPKIQPNSAKESVEKQQREAQCAYLTIQKKETIQVNRSFEVTSHRQRRQLVTLQPNQKKAEKIRMKSQSPSQKSLKLGSYESIQQQDCLPINKEVFYFAYAQEIQAMYKQLQPCVADLDMGFVRKLRKGGRRQQVKKRVKEVASNFIKHMTIIRESIDKYRKEYSSAHPQKKMRKQQRKSTLERLGPSENASKTSHGVRSMSTEKIYDERRKNLISSLSKKHRYADLQQQESQSNLLPSSQKAAKPKVEVSSNHQRVIDISFSPPRNKNQSKFLVISTGYISAELEIIQQKVKKIKAKASKQQQNLHRKKFLSKSKNSKSIDLQQEQLDLPYTSLPATIELSPASHLRLPKIRKGR